MKKRVLLIGQGGREHAMAWKIDQSPLLEKLYVAPGNPGISTIAECVNIAVTDIEALLSFALEKKIDLTIVGPELPLIEGIVNLFQEKGLKIFGPTAEAAQLEGSKVFAKNLFKKYSIPTAEYEVFQDIDLAKAYACKFTEQGKKIVIKADGLAAGKGVIIADTSKVAEEAVDLIMKEKSFGAAGDNIVIEEFLEGEELSFFAISDGEKAISLISAQDHKTVFDNDKGPNTGGMGAYTSPPLFTEELKEKIENEIINPLVKAMQEEGCPYQGVLYAGLMVDAKGPKALEFNARFGDPEAQVIMPMIEGDILEIITAVTEGELEKVKFKLAKGTAVCVVLASAGYPSEYEKGKIITGLEKLNPDTLAFHSGTTRVGEEIKTNGGRVLGIVSQGADIQEAVTKVYAEIAKVNFEGMHFRKDIASKAIVVGEGYC